jgi:penicillin-insensitive murein endopeptidase
MSLTVGSPNDGWQLRAKKVKNAPFLKVRRSTTAYGHPALVLMLKRSAKEIAGSARGAVMLVGDLSSKEGGPLAGHHSHQSGRDADLAFYMKKDGKPVEAPGFVAFGADGKAKDGSGYEFDDHRNWLLLRSWARDTRAGLSHVFISSPLKARLVKYAQSRPSDKKYLEQALALLKQPDNAEPHDDHFHVRISCPARLKEICTEQSKR